MQLFVHFSSQSIAGSTSEMTDQGEQNLLLQLLSGGMDSHYFHPRGSASQGRLLLPGSFNPLHQGHLRMAEIATQRLGVEVEFEIAAINVDKQPLDKAAISKRLRQFTRHGVHITRAARFVEKARLFNNATFVVGADTILRVGQVRYYSDDPQQHRDAIQEIADLGCRFLVFGRLLEDGFAEPGELALPPGLSAICDGVNGEHFRSDISSTQLRSEDSP